MIKIDKSIREEGMFTIRIRLMSYSDIMKVQSFINKNGGDGYVSTGSFIINGYPSELIDIITYIMNRFNSFELCSKHEMYLGKPDEVIGELTRMVRNDKLDELI